MVPSERFVRDLKLIDPGLFVRWEYWKEDGDGTTPVWPMVGPPFRRRPEQMPDCGRFVVYGMDRRRGPYSIFDVVHSDGSYHPLDRRVFDRLLVRRDVWDKVDDLIRAARKAETADKVKVPEDAKGPLADALESHFRATTGLRQFAMGSPGKPAKPLSGYYSVDRRRFKDAH